MDSQTLPQGRTSKPLTVYFLTHRWSGLGAMFESEDWSKVAGVPLVPLYWERLVQRGHEVHVVVVGEFEREKDFTVNGIHFYCRRLPEWLMASRTRRLWRTLFKPLQAVIIWKCLRTVHRLARTERPDLIYSYASTFVPAGYLVSRRYAVPHIAHYWGTWISHYLFHEPWYKRLRMWGQWLTYKFPLDLLIINNDGTEGDRVVEYMGFPKEKFRFWLNGTNGGIYKPDLDKAELKRSVGLQPSDKMIFQASRLDDWKRLDRSIGAMPTIVRRCPHARLVIAGDGPMRPKLERQAADLGVGEFVKFLGFVPHAQVQDLHNAADLFLTVYDLSNLGNPIMEALHSGTCVVAYNVGGTSHVMINDVTGVLLEKEELPRLGDIVADLLLDDVRRERLARGAQDFAQAHLDVGRAHCGRDRRNGGTGPKAPSEEGCRSS